MKIQSWYFKIRKTKVVFKKKKISDIHKIGDIIFVKKDNNSWTLKQYPRVNGGIVVLDPFTGDIQALVGGI